MPLTATALTLRDVFQALDYGMPSGGGAQRHVPACLHRHADTQSRATYLSPWSAKKPTATSSFPRPSAPGRAAWSSLSQVVASLDTPVLRVPDTEVAYGLLARHWRDRFDIPIIGVTGSVGKTTLKEMLAAALSPLGPVLKTAASQNNETGVPKALLQLTSEHKAAVIEMGMRGSGQIAYLMRHRPADGRRHYGHRGQPFGTAWLPRRHRRCQRRACWKPCPPMVVAVLNAEMTRTCRACGPRLGRGW